MKQKTRSSRKAVHELIRGVGYVFNSVNATQMENRYARWFVLLGCIIGLSGSIHGQGQWKRLLHDAFEMPDSVCLLEIDIPWEYQVERWPNNSILVETNLSLENASEAVLKGVLKAGRYAYTLDCYGDICTIAHTAKTFPVLQTVQGVVLERLKVRLFLPFDFEHAGDHLWTRMVK